ncbi:MAG: hypothetical protein CTY20_05610 [Hyphomicrobium sp.]|nr:MAG: hypothetical protein CTY20_05610 [Hyphomicrobium sp.]
MADKTTLVLPGSKMTVPTPIKRTIQVSASVVLTALVVLAVVLVNTLMISRTGSAAQGLGTWLAFIKRGDIQATMVLTALVTVLFVYWQRDKERR